MPSHRTLVAGSAAPDGGRANGGQKITNSGILNQFQENTYYPTNLSEDGNVVIVIELLEFG
jgi:hypothetical protein